ncbi:protein of unknown function [Amphibacillus marinus]|uniref:Uncharacterized protein n=1 Tax=Amphibacillus marinus TaxID=872970 RepID=A0A1H8IRH2_9BACI|nr:glycoside hydrolase family 2 TIM barrel-domain containing protein [Amphibacillus marinus]SEN70596.1 protein of unknown function [Amphibacillus marinus]
MGNTRIARNINLNWKFQLNDEPKAWYKGFVDKDWEDVTLPHDWSVHAPFSIEHSSGTGYLPGGTAWYRKKFPISEDTTNKTVRLTFEGVYNHAQVWVNSYYLGKRPYGYSSFSYDITRFISPNQDNVIAVRVDHQHTADSRWFTGSGIYRDVNLTITDQLHFAEYGVFPNTVSINENVANIEVDMTINNNQSSEADCIIINTLIDRAGEIVGQTRSPQSIGANEQQVIKQQLEIATPKLWSPDNPYLYNLESKIIIAGKERDCTTTPVGIRTIAFDVNQGFAINGLSTKLQGVCIHHDAGAIGAAVPKAVWKRRLITLKEMGCNAIRMSHNPPAPSVLDLCDELGFMVVDEAFDEWEGAKNKWSTGHNVYPPKHHGYFEDFPQWGETDLKAMVLRDRHHPSIILWSIGNEVDYPNDPYCHPYFKTMTGNNDNNKPAAEREYDPNKPNADRLVYLAKQLVSYVKEVDKTRPVTAALAFPELSNITGLADTLDVVGYNYKEHLYQQDHQAYPNRILLGSENSSSVQDWEIVKKNNYISGQFVWTGIDFLGEAKGWPVRASPVGFLDLAGFTKPSYYQRKSMWNPEPMVYLAAVPSNEGDDINIQPHWNWSEGTVDLHCYSNCDTAELFVNGQSQGAQAVSVLGEPLVWQVDYQVGEVKVVGYIAGQEMTSASLITTDDACSIRLTSDRSELKADGLDIAHFEIELLDKANATLRNVDTYISISVSGPAELIGLENGNIRDTRAYSESGRNLFNGQLLGYLRSTDKKGEVIVQAEAKGIKPHQFTLKVT